MPVSQDGFEYTEKILDTFEKYLSPERLAGYYAIARGDRWTGIRLYERNTELSEALYGITQCLEVALRNAIHIVFTSQLGTPEWYDKIPLEDPEREAIQEAKDSILEKAQPVTPGRIVAELTFGFWVKLFSGAYEKQLWVKYLYRIFPITLKRTVLHSRLIQLKTLRNRIAHHERILGKRDLRQDYADLLETIGWISKDIEAWVKSTNCFEERAAKKLPKKPKTEPQPQQPETVAAKE